MKESNVQKGAELARKGHSLPNLSKAPTPVREDLTAGFWREKHKKS